MHTYNLRFAAASTPKQRAIYRELHPLMMNQRDKVVGKTLNDGAEPPPAAPVDNPTAIFYGLDSTHLNPKPATAKP